VPKHKICWQCQCLKRKLGLGRSPLICGHNVALYQLWRRKLRLPFLKREGERRTTSQYLVLLPPHPALLLQLSGFLHWASGDPFLFSRVSHFWLAIGFVYFLTTQMKKGKLLSSAFRNWQIDKLCNIIILNIRQFFSLFDGVTFFFTYDCISLHSMRV